MNQTKGARQPRPSSALIFVVDDNALLVEYACTVLKTQGYRVAQFTDPKAALKAIQDANPKPAALITDYDMGEMNGLELIDCSHKVHPALRTVLLSGTIDGAFVANHPTKVNRFLVKPYLPDQLKTTLEEALQP